jgi:hypothetical protein
MDRRWQDSPRRSPELRSLAPPVIRREGQDDYWLNIGLIFSLAPIGAFPMHYANGPDTAQKVKIDLRTMDCER